MNYYLFCYEMPKMRKLEKYNFSETNSYDVFKKAPPINTYEDVEADIERCRRTEYFWPIN